MGPGAEGGVLGRKECRFLWTRAEEAEVNRGLSWRQCFPPVQGLWRQRQSLHHRDLRVRIPEVLRPQGGSLRWEIQVVNCTLFSTYLLLLGLFQEIWIWQNG